MIKELISKKKIAVITATRAEYGLLYYLMKEIQADSALELQVIVSGMHLSPEFGLTYKLIEQDGFSIAEKVEILLSSDSAVGTAKSMGLALIGFADVFSRLQPDLIVLLGDRFESLAIAQAALVQKIPIAHIHGGELSEGAIDDAIRHSITKMSHLHFVAAEPYRKRVIQLGEQPNRVFNVGAPGLERIKRFKLLSLPKLEKAINFKFGKQNFMVTYLPATLTPQENQQALSALFTALDAYPEAKIIFTKANADEMGRFVNTCIDEYVAKNKHRAAAYTTLGDLNYLSALQYVDLVMGNSSSGLIEVPVFFKPTINLGSRQSKRLRAASIIDCEINSAAINEAISQALSPAFKKKLNRVVSLYGQGNTASNIKKEIKKVNLKELINKCFYDVME